MRNEDLPGAVFLLALVASCFRGALPPVDFLAVCLVLAIFGCLIYGLGDFVVIADEVKEE